MKISRRLSEVIVEATSKDDVEKWLTSIEEELEGLSWKPVGGRPNNIHTIHASTSSGLALVERYTNCIDALIEHIRTVDIGIATLHLESQDG